MRGILSTEKFFIRGDTNGHIESLSKGYDDVNREFGFGKSNEGEALLLDFARTFGLVVANSSF